MELTGISRLPVSRQAVWNALLSPDALATCIPGCTAASGSPDSEMHFTLSRPIGGALVTMRTTCRVAAADAPHRLTITGTGRCGAVTLLRGTAEMTLTEAAAGTEVQWRIACPLGGIAARLGERALHDLATAMVDEFFTKLGTRLGAGAVDQAAAVQGQTDNLTPPKRLTLARRGGTLGVLAYLLSREARIARAIRPVFDTAYYCAHTPEAAKPGTDPVRHYVLFGAWEGRDPTPEFSTANYLRAYPDVRSAKVNAFWHYLTYGRFEGRLPDPGPDLDGNIGLAAGAENPAAEDALASIRPHVDAAFYTRHYGHLLDDPADPAAHYLHEGWTLGCDPSEAFATRYYLDANPDVRASAINPLLHYITHGRAEGRAPYSAERGAEPILDSIERHDPEALAHFAFDPVMAPRPIDAPILLFAAPQTSVALASQRCRQALDLTRADVFLLGDAQPSFVHRRLHAMPADRLGALLTRLEETGAETVALWSTEVVPNACALPLLQATLQDDAALSLVGANIIDDTYRLVASGYAASADGRIVPTGQGQSALSGRHSCLRTVQFADTRLAMACRADLAAALQDDDAVDPAQLSLALMARGKAAAQQGMAVATICSDAATTTRFGALDKAEHLAALAWQEGRDARETVIFVDGPALTPDRDAGSVTASNFLDIFRARGAEVWFFADVARRFDPKYSAALARRGIHSACLPDYPDLETLLSEIAATGRQRVTVVLTRVHSGGRYLEIVRRMLPRAKIIFNTVDLHGLREAREARQSGNAADAFRAQATFARETGVVRNADATIVLSALEKAELDRSLAYADIRLIPMINEAHRSDVGFDGRQDILFVGSFLHAPNIDAVEHFVARIWPIVQAKLPSATFRIIGEAFPDWLRAKLPPGVEVAGFVPDLAEAMDRALLSVAPLRFGAGIKGKIGTSLSHGVPCVASPAAVEGMDLRDGTEVLVAGDPAQFARAVTELCTDRALWQKLSDGGFAAFEARYSRDAVGTLLNRLLDDLHAAPRDASAGQRDSADRSRAGAAA